MELNRNLANGLKVSIPSLEVRLKRGSSIESFHKVHAVICDTKGRVLMKAGNTNYLTFIRSSLKPFQAIPFVSSGACDYINCGDKGLAIACGSHSGSTTHAREVFKILWNSELEVSNLKCPIPKSKESKLEHNCSGKHAAFLATCKKLNWPLENYLDSNHQIQIEINRRISEMLGIPSEELVSSIDNCGAPTLSMTTSQMALLYAHLGSSNNAELEKISRAMLMYPEFIADTGRFDTELIKRSHGQVISKGGSEGIQCLSRIGEGIGLAIKVEDGSKRAKYAAAIHVIKQLEWITPTGIKELEDIFMNFSEITHLEVEGSLKFQEN